MNSKITYSFVIPHNNTPNLLQRLVDSIPEREDIEIIIVDDNSDADKKADVSRADVKTIYIDEEHSKGAGRARNIGMSLANGKWILFADADDFYKQDFIDVLDEYKDSDLDLLFFNVDYVDSDTLQPILNDKRKKYSDVVRQYDGSLQSTDNLLYFSWTPWHKMYCSSFLKGLGLQFEEVPKGNDVFFSMQVGYFAKKWKVESRALYIVAYYRNSITFNPKYLYQYKFEIANFRKRARFFQFIGHPEWNKDCIRGKHRKSVLLYILRAIKRRPITGIKALLYYATHFLRIEKHAYDYVSIVKSIERKIRK